MSLFDAVLGKQNADMVAQLAQSVGIDQNDVQNIVSQLLPAVSRGIKSNAASSEGLQGLLNDLKTGNYQRYLDHPEALQEEEAKAEGNEILSHIFGSKDVSRNVAAHAAQETGTDTGIVKRLLPLVAAAVMAALSKQTSDQTVSTGSAQSYGQTGASPSGNWLTSFLDADKDGDITDDLLNLAKKFF
ncbi:MULTISPECIES: DUF937 domain-containing protein [Methylobacter]|jgi:hypothetical protein|uniref:DUF937 domain-containing protein n=1 Tax=Methylobacter TaxID=429 RepID=UPI0003FED425|nr:DUF937 domain-containing protein [Methylobacter luteus]